MPSLTDKLKDLGVQIGTSDIKPPQKQAHAVSLPDALHGSWEETRAGNCFIVRKHLPFDLQHGENDLSRFPKVGIFENISTLSGISDVPFDQYLFIDTETTGLSGGAGTYVFLAGAAKYDKDGIHFAQFFLQDPSSELCQLAALEEFCVNAKVIVSYNGKSFDLPRIKNRYLFHGWPAPFQNIYHLDLLHIVRRLWKNHLPGCSLGDIEYHLLGIQRSSHDIPGWQVSEKFFEFLQTGDPIPLEGVFYHNEVDVISLVSLLSYITDRLTNPLAQPYENLNDLVSIGRYLSDLNQNDISIDILTKALANKSLQKKEALVGLKTLASIHKKNSDHEQAVPLWKKSAELDDIQAMIELAMYYEHKLLNYQEAIHWTLSAQEISKRSRLSDNKYKEALIHRLSRLKLKEKQHTKS